MAVTWAMISQPADLKLRELVPPAATTQVGWAHSSDLPDPTPFLQGGEMLMTNCSQLTSDTITAEYVQRLAAAGIAVLAFSSGVVHKEAPPALISACERAGLPLIEVPYETPFIAVGQRIAKLDAQQARARVDWALATQNAVSAAALGQHGLAGALARAGERLGATIELVYPGDEPPVPGAPGRERRARPELEVAAVTDRLLRANRRARIEVTESGVQVYAQTLGASGRLRGVLTCVRKRPFDDADRAVLATLTALAEVSAEQSQELQVGLRDLAEQLYGLLKDGRITTVRKAVANIPLDLPGKTFVVIRLSLDELDAVQRAAIERRSYAEDSGLFVAVDGKDLVIFASPRAWRGLRPFLVANALRAGVSDLTDWAEVTAGIAQARRSLENAGPGRVLEFAEFASTRMVGLIARSAATEIARSRLAGLPPEVAAAEILNGARVWFAHLCSWESASHELGIHRHTLKAQVRRLAAALDLDIESFEGRAELWALLSAAEQEP